MELDDTAKPANTTPPSREISDEEVERIIEDSGGHWREGGVVIDAPGLTAMIRRLSAGAVVDEALLALARSAAPTPYEYDVEHCSIVGNGHSPKCGEDCTHVTVEMERSDLDFMIASANYVGAALAAALKGGV